ncbi:hypothetical protein [Bacillus cereus]|uniref:Uncharacterized protein n=1 Tax=Bacillus cereus VD184 TaxID=1053242 RepID=A0A9W5RAZ6_BACCE|nr:hypothetical protein [Bacillus cereus]EOQ18619.1 hypothetical protein IKC_05120 [Bacillus cereus VD184]
MNEQYSRLDEFFDFGCWTSFHCGKIFIVGEKWESMRVSIKYVRTKNLPVDEQGDGLTNETATPIKH